MNETVTTVDEFVDECLVESSYATVTSDVLYQNYIEYCESQKKESISRIAFTKEMTSIGKETGMFGFIPRKNTRQTAQFIGITLK